jgi:hypothetical protein
MHLTISITVMFELALLWILEGDVLRKANHLGQFFLPNLNNYSAAVYKEMRTHFIPYI